MAWLPISWTVPQYMDGNGDPYSGAVLKFYQDGTTTNTNMATDNTGGTTLADVVLDANGYPSNGGSIFIPHIDQAYKLALYPTEAAADADTGAIWTIDNLTPADLTDTDTDELAKVSSNDTTAGYLNGKLTGGTGITLTENTDGGNETLDVGLTGDGLLITESADHNNTPAAGKGEYWVKSDAPNTAYFTDDAGNDFTLSPPAQISNHVRSGRTQLVDGTLASAVAAIDVAGGAAETTWTTVGPTGSGATIISSTLDNVPSSARILIFQCDLQATASGAGVDVIMGLYVATGGVTANAGLNAEVAGFQHHAETSGDVSIQKTTIQVPCGNDQIFQVYWTSTSTSADVVNLRYRGFIA